MRTYISGRFVGRVVIMFTALMSIACSSSGGKSHKDAGGTGGTTGFEPSDGTDGGFLAGDGTATTDGTAADTAGSDGTDATGTDGTGASESCSSDADCKTFKGKCGTGGVCVECLADGDCTTAGEVCFQGNCTGCVPGVKTCSGNTVVECQNGAPTVVETCPADGVCNSGKCYACYPGLKRCSTDGKAEECKADGSGWETKDDCAAQGLECAVGVCKGGCGANAKTGTNAGCEFYAVDLDNAVDLASGLDAQHAQFSVIASNTSTTATAKVTLTEPNGTKQEKEVAPLSLQVFNLPSTYSIDGGGITKSGIHLVSTQPITVYQFNPLSNEGVFSNDASVLLPTGAAGTDYYAMTRQDITTFHGFITVIGLQAGTQVTVQATAACTGGGAGDIPAGGTKTFTLGPAEVLNLESTVDGGDLTGSHITSDKPVVVYSGHEAAVTSTKCCADHLEQQMVPVPAWGKSYVLARTKKRGKEQEYFRIVAAENGTTVTVNPAIISPPSFTLNAGQFKEIVFDGDFQVTADKPIMAAQFIASSFEVLGDQPDMCSSAAECYPGYTCFFGCTPPSCFAPSDCPAGHTCADGQCLPIGDPTLILAVSAEQWQTSYVFLTPTSYAEDYVTIVAEPGSNVTLDGNAIPDAGFTAISGTTYKVYRGSLGDGVHNLKASKPVSVIVYGYDRDVSYGYPGGLGLAKLPQ